ncbi:serine hydrolase domain-containing protein [Sphingomonas alpina]|uniref:Beta-lactamase family protein n=1 Tax=Sphingomonas alpina TaxID=653931 RepID=A0A7H0LM78_9SPHN|nr:serine hydrolase domain-containing protein [Sphingomonas alpina]QNQ10781.1 beta-lactamase family protein [Sphingomonas alpina]
MMKYSPKTLTAGALLAIAPLTVTAAPLAAKTPAVKANRAAAAVAISPVSLAALPSFIDGVMAEQIATREVAGGVVTIVYKGKVLLSRGYGYANVDKRIPVDPARTLFRPGSVSKLFTWTALMQQVEQGKVDLDADVNTYLDYKIPALGSTPIRVRDLFQHTPGMSDIGGITAENVGKLVPYRDWMKAHIPARVWAPGTEISYSNYGAALAGYIVERVSGEPYPDYVEKHIFRPLGMMTTTFREPLTGAMRDHMATGYEVKDGRLLATPFEYYSLIMPAGSASATAPDMARFMLAMLNKGQLGTARILTPASVAFLESNSFANAPHLAGMAHGFMVHREAGPRLVGHGGNTQDFHSNLTIAPAADFGFFVSFTGGTGSYLGRTELSDAIIGKVFPQKPAPRWTGSEKRPPLGGYRSNRRDYAEAAQPEYDLKISMPADHIVTVENSGRKTSWEQVGPGLYELVTGARDGGPYDRLEFYGTNADPRLSFGSQPHVTYHFVKP